MKSFQEIVETSEDGFEDPAHFEDSVSGVVRSSVQRRHGQGFDVELLEEPVIPRQRARRLRQHALRHRLQRVEIAGPRIRVVMVFLVLKSRGDAFFSEMEEKRNECKT